MNITWKWEEAKELAADRTEWRQRVAQCYQQDAGSTEQNNKIVFFISYFENSFWSILLLAKYFLEITF